MRAARFTGPLIVIAANAAMIAWTWRSCPDPVIDFAREIYIPWRMSEGQVLYRDLNYFDGPLAPYGLTLVFDVFGASLRAIKLTNAAVILLMAVLIYRLVLAISDRWAATVAGVTFAVAFACGQFTRDACFNFLTPYSHDLTWGVAMSLMMIACLGRAARSSRFAWLALAGGLLGLIALTKAEVLLAAMLAAGVGIAALTWSLKWNRWRCLRASALILGCALAPVVIALALLCTRMPAIDALEGIAGAWKFIGNRQLMEMSYFRWLMGTDAPERNIRDMLLWTGRYGIILVPAALAGWAVRGRSNPVIAGASIVLLAATCLILSVGNMPLMGLTRPLPLFLAAIGLSLVLRMLRGGPDAPALVMPLTFAVLSAALLAKVFLRVDLTHYGFALAMPGMMLLIAALVGWVPRWVGRGSAAGWVPRSAVLGAWSVIVVGLLVMTRQSIAGRPHPVGEGAISSSPTIAGGW